MYKIFDVVTWVYILSATIGHYQGCEYDHAIE